MDKTWEERRRRALHPPSHPHQEPYASTATMSRRTIVGARFQKKKNWKLQSCALVVREWDIMFVCNVCMWWRYEDLLCQLSSAEEYCGRWDGIFFEVEEISEMMNVQSDFELRNAFVIARPIRMVSRTCLSLEVEKRQRNFFFRWWSRFEEKN